MVDGRGVRGSHPTGRGEARGGRPRSRATVSCGRPVRRSTRWSPTWEPSGPVWWWCRPTRPTRSGSWPTSWPTCGRRRRWSSAAEQAGWVRDAVPGPLVLTGPALELPDGAPGPARPRRARRPGTDLLHLRDHRAAQGCGPAPPQPAGRDRVGSWSPGGWSSEDRLVHCLPIFHAHGLAVGAYGTLSAGGSAVLLPGFDPAAVGDAARDHRATLFFGVPTMYHRLVASGRAGALRGLRLCVSGSAPLPADLHAEASRAVGSVVLERYGMTETLMNASNPYEGERRAGTVGFPLPRVEIVARGRRRDPGTRARTSSTATGTGRGHRRGVPRPRPTAAARGS